jgi:hypothetical protein
MVLMCWVYQIADEALESKVASSLKGHYRVKNLGRREQVFAAAEFF